MEPSSHYHLKYKICVSGAAETGHCSKDALDKAKEIGFEIAKHGAILVTGATTGFPYWAAHGAKEAEGISIGISPASTEKEHVEKFELPLDYMDMIVYTGFGYPGRNLMLTRASDAVIIGCGRMGTLNEFTIAFEDRKPIGVLLDAGGTTEWIDELIRDSHRGGDTPVVYDADPKALVEKVIDLIKKEKVVKV
ncbi:MAG: hypothetical protein A3J55_02880 [Candidatus Ryanbacteria bacterium RIFCSPHIGHO2_02_FULL_45_17b]|uniref:Protein containing YHS domain protein n=1 Tax=Candidatus Ryanbacteria bacterium RIFCSPHIGHO2_01_FULL_45_22 TaxID=1802114 RepID=A0A1G2G0U7_9BACT|nr:MAG: hypothetical protein A2719_05580 [Candidatus Ryanbacteria bacterium RIFCSPHIGHO2_01_FULL_45_22]OGZ47355.1 MAG: hypothetical protein A3J55_02880 [Candidatus Ryanbacteria bacterium RIFCSPHIGHO2_02_FULL_45_17b]